MPSAAADLQRIRAKIGGAILFFVQTTTRAELPTYSSVGRYSAMLWTMSLFLGSLRKFWKANLALVDLLRDIG